MEGQRPADDTIAADIRVAAAWLADQWWEPSDATPEGVANRALRTTFRVHTITRALQRCRANRPGEPANFMAPARPRPDAVDRRSATALVSVDGDRVHGWVYDDGGNRLVFAWPAAEAERLRQQGWLRDEPPT